MVVDFDSEWTVFEKLMVFVATALIAAFLIGPWIVGWMSLAIEFTK